MERPLEIAFHNLDPSPSLEAEIRARVDELAKRCTALIGCRVSVEGLHKQHQKGNVHEVHIVLSLPGGDLAVSREPHHAKERYAEPDAWTAMRDAFRAAERQLEIWKGRRREDTSGPDGRLLSGQVALIEPGADHGFILNSTGSQVYFHRDSLTEGDFEALKRGDPVRYVEEEGDAGPTATKVRVAREKKG